ncbi:oxidoreductase [Nocardia neocaledoniensis NBRC 108232]|uniref:FAD/FMN-containing dehydrogenase n=1 Tax=Nocardia neocaledoniensis TaxID=236511 RepID=A0A317N622_9NOCA|nr:FAD-binding oxidoreductase [Nocardia neocaledoniensis]PWV70452.1 FAD/FMN-containing dehydrogenase [Nocardia neocaledoniensis]GEM30818.1 oxidoreductase [Nocardia neocaledoniensis NBRC 108232]
MDTTVSVENLISELSEIVGRAHVLTDRAITTSYVTDWTGRWRGSAVAVVRPGTTGEVAQVMRLCRQARIKVVPQGGNTGLVGGSIPLEGELVVSSTRLCGDLEVDPVARTIAAGAGVTVAQAQAAARAAGLVFGVDLASRDLATLGGIVATNAGGIRTIKYGDTRSRLLGIEAVQSDGTVLTRWKSIEKDNVGYHLPALLAGSEGTLAYITRVLMKLAVPPAAVAVGLVGVDSIRSGLAVVDDLRRRGTTLEAAELMTAEGIELVRRYNGLASPMSADAPYYLLVEASHADDPLPGLLETIGGLGGIVDAVFESGRGARLWRYRESHTQVVALSSTTPVVKLDVTVPLIRVSRFVDELESAVRVRFPAVRPILFGHVGQGNIHVNLLDVDPSDREQVTDHVFGLVADHAGSISAEHGVGRAKAPWLHLGRTSADIAAMQAIRLALDPSLTLNPGVLSAPSRSSGSVPDER